MQIAQSRLVRKILNAPLNIKNFALHRNNLKIPIVEKTVPYFYKKFYLKLGVQENPFIHNITVTLLYCEAPYRKRLDIINV